MEGLGRIKGMVMGWTKEKRWDYFRTGQTLWRARADDSFSAGGPTLVCL